MSTFAPIPLQGPGREAGWSQRAGHVRLGRAGALLGESGAQAGRGDVFAFAGCRLDQALWGSRPTSAREESEVPEGKDAAEAHRAAGVRKADQQRTLAVG